jgi:hypothetical protein
MRRFILPLFSNLGDGDRADLAGTPDVCAAARLQVDAAVVADRDTGERGRCPSVA